MDIGPLLSSFHTSTISNAGEKGAGHPIMTPSYEFIRDRE
jgi:hypothetical protein